MHMLPLRKHFPRFLDVLLLVVLAVVGFLVYRQQVVANIRDSVDLSTRLKGFIVPNIVVGRKSYVVDEGVATWQGDIVPPASALSILRTAYFSVTNRLDPILAFEGTDPEKLASAVAKLKDSLHSLSSNYDVKTQEMLAENFYPIPFLETLSALEEERRAVLARPTLQNATAYSAALLESLTQYRTALKKSESAFAALGGVSTNIAYTFPGGVTSFETIQNSLATLDVNAAAAQIKTKARLACLRGNAPCESLATLLPGRVDIPLAASLSVALPLAHARVKSLLSTSERARSESFGKTFNERGVVILSKSACMSDLTPLYAYLWETSKEPNAPVSRFQPLNDLYFYDLRQKTQSGFYTRMHESGIDFLGQGISNLYECPDSGLEAMRVISLYALARSIADRPLFYGTTTSDPSFRKIAEEEQQIADSPYILESAVTRYVADLSALIQEKGEQALAQETSNETVYEAERRITLLSNQSALFNEQISTVIATNSVVNGIEAVVSKSMPLLPLYLSRSYPSLLYLAGNESIAPTPVSFFKERSSESLSKFQIVSYSTLRKTYSDADILRFMNASNQAYRNADISI